MYERFNVSGLYAGVRTIVHAEDGTYWAEVPELPGCFATGRNLNELNEALNEAIGMCLDDDTEMDSRAPSRERDNRSLPLRNHTSTC